MTAREGDLLPNIAVQLLNGGNVAHVPVPQLCGSGLAVLFAVPGAFFPACSTRHLPGFIEYAAAFRAKGVGFIGCLSVNDAFVMHAWGRQNAASDSVTLLADGNGAFARAMGLMQDSTAVGLGMRSQRYALVARDGIITRLMVEQPGSFEVSAAPAVLAQIQT
jgi:peroxiredoxin (alkyl hydroperoxide reductase subunit C)